MTFDEAGQQGSAFEIEGSDAGRYVEPGEGSGGGDGAAMDEHDPVVVHLFPVEDAVRPQEGIGGVGGYGGLGAGPAVDRIGGLGRQTTGQYKYGRQKK